MNNRIQDLRALHNWARGDLGERLDVSRQTVNAIETGKHAPGLALALRIATLFRKSIETIFDPQE